MADIYVKKLAEFVTSWNLVVLEVVDYKSVPVGNMSGKKGGSNMAEKYINTMSEFVKSWNRDMEKLAFTHFADGFIFSALEHPQIPTLDEFCQPFYIYDRHIGSAMLFLPLLLTDL